MHTGNKGQIIMSMIGEAGYGSRLCEVNRVE